MKVMVTQAYDELGTLTLSLLYNRARTNPMPLSIVSPKLTLTMGN